VEAKVAAIFARDMARLAHAGHDQAPARRPDHRDRCDDRPAESILDGVGERRDPAGLGLERAQRRSDQVFAGIGALVRFRVRHSLTFINPATN